MQGFDKGFNGLSFLALLGALAEYIHVKLPECIHVQSQVLFQKIFCTRNYLQLGLEPLACFGNGGRGDSQQDGLLRYGELQVRENIGADIALCQIVMRFPERFGPEV